MPIVTEINLCEIIIISTKCNDKGEVVKTKYNVGKVLKSKKVNKNWDRFFMENFRMRFQRRYKCKVNFKYFE